MSEGTPPPIETRMDYSAEDVRGLAEFVDKLAGRISDAVALARSARSDLEEGWDDNTGAKARASLTVGADQAEVLGQKAGGFANTLRTYAGILSRANDHLEDARTAGRPYMTGTQMPFPDHPYAMRYQEVPESGDPRLLAEITGVIAHRDAYMAVHDHVEDAKRVLRETDLENEYEGLREDVFFGGLSFVSGEIDQLAQAYNQRFLNNAELRASVILSWPAHSPADRLANEGLAQQQRAFAVERTRGNFADLVSRISKSGVGSGITVFAISFDIYNGVEPEKAIFDALVGSAGGLIGVGLISLAAPPAWAVALAGVAGGLIADGQSDRLWEAVPEDAREWIKEQREQIEESQQRSSAERDFREEYQDERHDYPYPDIKGL